jgi:ubiquinone/menaquinone biosynthesis C-methylase UbiE
VTRVESAATTLNAFDAAAAGYDAAFTQTRLGIWLRDMVRQRVRALYSPGQQVLELGCGTGEDAVWLAQNGLHVVATDASPVMLEIARAKVASAGVAGNVELELLNLNDTRTWSPGRTFDGVLSNFGPLNCLYERVPLAQALARWLRPGGWVALVVMGPLCPWEIAWHLLHGQARVALRRFRGGATARVGGVSLPIWYPSSRRMRAEFAPFFFHVQTVGIGVWLPPT